MQNGYVESVNGKMRDELLNETLFFSLDHARSIVAAWMDDYNTIRPHSSLAYQTPAAYAENSPQQAIMLRPCGAAHVSLLHTPLNRAYKRRRL